MKQGISILSLPVMIIDSTITFMDAVADAAPKIIIGYGLGGSVQRGPVRDKEKKERLFAKDICNMPLRVRSLLFPPLQDLLPSYFQRRIIGGSKNL